MAEWESRRLGDMTSKIGSGATPRGGSAVYRESGVAFIRSQNVLDSAFSTEGLAFIDDVAAEQLRGVAVESGDVLINITGDSVLRCCLVPDSILPARVSQHVAIIRSDGSFVPKFLQGMLVSPAMKDHMFSLASGGATRHAITKAQLVSLEVLMPGLREQRAIAAVLDALDDKIAANTKLTIIADELVRTEYRALSSSVAESVTLGSLAENVRDLAEPDGSDSLYVGLEHVPRHLMWLTGWGSMADVSSTKARFVEQDVLFGKLRPYFHKVVSAPSSGVCSTDILVLRAVDMELAGFVLAAAASDAVVDAVTASSEGTRMPRASWKDLAACEVPWPGDAMARTFSVRVASLRDHVQARLRESERLVAIRDALLPAFMSGRLIVRDAGATVEGALDGSDVEPEALATGTLW